MTSDFSRTTHSELESEDLNMLAAHTTQFWRSRPLQGRRPAAFFAALVVYIIVILVAAPQAQQPQAFNPTGAGVGTAVRDAASGSEIDLMVGRSTVLNVGAPIARVSLTVPDIADALVTAPAQLLIHGKKPGTISLFVWDKAGAISTYEVKVRRDLSALIDADQAALPGRGHHRRSATARTSSSPARSRASTSSRRPRTWPPATSTRRKTSSTC